MKVERGESIARSVPEISVHVVRGVLRRKRPMKQVGFEFFCGKQKKIKQKEMLLKNNCKKTDEDQQ